MKSFNITSIFAVLLSILVVGCSTNKLEITTDSKKVDFAQFKTYQWLDIIQGPAEIEKEVYVKITKEINQNLAAKGYSAAPNVKPDFFIRYGVTAVNEVNVKQYNSYEGYSNVFSWQRGYGLQSTPQSSAVKSHEVDVKRVLKGSIIVDIINPLSNKIVWRGTARKQISNSATPKKRNQVIEQAVMLILKDFPSSNK
jgi:hypothetical protein